MILKRMYYDPAENIPHPHVVTDWTEGVIGASLAYDENWQSSVLTLRFKGEKEPVNLVVHEGEGLYLCNDEGRTVEVISRLHTPA